MLAEKLRSRARLAGAVDTVLEARQLLGANRTAGVEFAGRDTDLGAEAELAAVGKLRRGVVQHDRRVDLVEEAFGAISVISDDRIGVVRAVLLDMRDRAVEAVDHLYCDDLIEIFGVPVLVGRALHAGI